MGWHRVSTRLWPCLSSSTTCAVAALMGLFVTSLGHAVTSTSLTCTQYDMTHTGCDLPAGSGLKCANITLSMCTAPLDPIGHRSVPRCNQTDRYTSTARSSPPWGLRFMYDTGGRTVFVVAYTDLAQCALRCWGESLCIGVVVVNNETCYGVNDTTHAIGTREASESYVVTRVPNCVPKCTGGGDMLAFATDSALARPVAAVGGVQQCQQYCDIAAAVSPEGCAGIVHDPVGSMCWTVNSTKATRSFGSLRSYTRIASESDRTSRSPTAHAPTPSLQWFVADDTEHVFDSAQPTQTAFCSPTGPRSMIDWAGAPGQYLAAQLALLTTSTVALQLTLTSSDLVQKEVKRLGLGSKNTASVIPASAIELMQVGFVAASPSPTYSNEIGAAWYPDVLQPIESTARYELAATGSTGGLDGFRFAYDSGGREIDAIKASSVGACQASCDVRDACRGVVYNGSWCVLTNDSALTVPTTQPSQSFRRLRAGMVLVHNTTRAVWVALNIPPATPAGQYSGFVTVSATPIQAELGSATESTGNTPRRQDKAEATVVSVPISLTVWPIAAACLEAETRKFGSAWGFDHSVVPQLYPAAPGMLNEFTRFTNSRHISASGLTAWNSLDGHGGGLTREAIADLLTHQDLFCAAELGITPHSPNASAINASWVAAKLATIEARIANLSAWGVLNRSYIYAFDEAGPEYAPAVRLLFGEVKARWPEVKTLAVLNWNASALVDVVDILVFQYQELSSPAMAATKDAFVRAGKQVWGYHCISPSPSVFLNTFLEIPLMKARLIPWLAAAENFSGWLYWYTNWGSRHAASATDTALHTLTPLRELELRTGRSSYDPQVINGAHFTNEDGNLLYSGERGPLSSVRLEQLRRGWEDRALLSLLTSSQQTTLAQRLVRTATNYTFDAELLEAARRNAAMLVGERQC